MQIRIMFSEMGKPGNPNSALYLKPEEALAKLVDCLTSDDTVITCIGLSNIILDCPKMRERVEFDDTAPWVPNKIVNDMKLLFKVSLLYIQARPHLCNESVRALVQ